MTDLRQHWTLDPEVRFLNHGSFGACPRPVLAVQDELRARIEREPVKFFIRELEARLDEARGALGEFVGADPEDLAFVPNATTGVSTVVRSLSFEPGSEILTTNHAYNACRNALEYAAGRAGARVVVAPVPFPLADGGEVVDAVLAAVTERTRLALVDHVTSPTGLVFPLERLVAALAGRGVEVLVDGAHAPGMLPLAIAELGARGVTYYTGNCHKWLCTPKGSGFLWVRRDRQSAIHPLAISHGANSKRLDRSRFRLEFDWGGTDDPTAFLCVPAALRFLGGLLPGGWEELRKHNRELALAARRLLCRTLAIDPPSPDEMIANLVAVPLPEQEPGTRTTWFPTDPLQDILWERDRIEVPVFAWPAPPRRLLRIAVQVYNRIEEYEALAVALGRELSFS